MIKFRRKKTDEFTPAWWRIVRKGRNNEREEQVTTAHDVFDFDSDYLKKEKSLRLFKAGPTRFKS